MNGVCVADLALSIVESTNDFSTLSLTHEFKAMEDPFKRFPSYTESWRLLRCDLDEEEYEIKEGAHEEFVSWVDSNSVKYPASADLEEMMTKTTKDDMTDSDLKTTTVLMDKNINFLKKESEDFDHKEYINRVDEAIIKKVDDESYCPELKRVFDNKDAVIIYYCKKARNEIPEERPTDKKKKPFKFPVSTLERNVVKSDEIR